MARTVPFVHLRRQHAAIQDDLEAAFLRVVEGSAFILGEEVERFEAEFAEYCGVRHCVGVASGTAALTLAMLSAGIGPGDEVIVPAHTFIASALGVLHAGATPVLCDVDEGTALIDVESAEAVVGEQTAAVLPVHLYGQVCDMQAVSSFADRHRLAVIEDAAQAHGASYRGRRAGSFGTAAAFSFYPSKNLGAMGDGGAICTNDAELAERARILRHLGQRRKGEHVVAGFNERLDGLQAALLRVKLAHLDEWNERRREHATIYREALRGRVRLLEEQTHAPCVYHLFPIRSTNRNGLATRLARGAVQTGVHYTPALHDQPSIRSRSRVVGEYPAAANWAAEELSLPMFEHLDAGEIQTVIERCVDAASHL